MQICFVLLVWPNRLQSQYATNNLICPLASRSNAMRPSTTCITCSAVVAPLAITACNRIPIDLYAQLDKWFFFFFYLREFIGYTQHRGVAVYAQQLCIDKRKRAPYINPLWSERCIFFNHRISVIFLFFLSCCVYILASRALQLSKQSTGGTMVHWNVHFFPITCNYLCLCSWLWLCVWYSVKHDPKKTV